MSSSHHFSNVDAAKWTRIKAKLAEQGVTVTEDAGGATHDGIALAWIHDPLNQTLTVTLLKRAFYDPSTATIDADIEHWITAA